MKNSLIILLSVCMASTAYANRYYVSAAGNDANSGLSENEAWSSLNQVSVFQFLAGDTISFRGGDTFPGVVYNESFISATVGNPILINSYGSGKAIISSGDEAGMVIYNQGNLKIQSIRFQGSGYKISRPESNGIAVYTDSFHAGYIENIIIDDVECYGYGGWGINFYTDAELHGFRHISITNSSLHDNGWGGLILSSSYLADGITSNIINSDFYVAHTKTFNNHGRFEVKSRWSGGGIFLSGIERGLIEYCESYNNGKENGSTYAGPVGVFCSDSRYVTIQYSSSHHNLGGPGKKDGGGFDIDIGSYGCVVQYCTSYDNEGAGYGLYNLPSANPFSNDTVRYNTSTNDARNLDIYGSLSFWGQSSASKITNCEVYGNQINISKIGWAVHFLNDNLSNINIHDNDFCIESPATFVNLAMPHPISPYANVWNNRFNCAGKPSPVMPVNYRGAFPAGPAPMWTEGWTNYDPLFADYAGADSVISTAITFDIELSGSKKYLLRGPVLVKNGATISINGGCIIKGEKSTPNSSLIITQGSSIRAIGSPTKPVIFTSDQPLGQRMAGDWGGIYILGKSHYNGANGETYLDGFIEDPDTKFGGGVSPDGNDNSGSLEFVRIEFAGAKMFSSNQGVGIFLGAVGAKTTIGRLQVSHSNGDGFHWMGGSLNSYHVVSYKNRMHNWKAGGGHNGVVQFGLALRDPNFASTDLLNKSNGLEMENDNLGSENTAFTSPLFSNITEIGPLRGSNQTNIAAGYGSNVHFANNAHARVLNSIFFDYPAGIFINGENTTMAATGVYLATAPNPSPANLVFRNNVIGGNLPGAMLQKSLEWNIGDWFRTNSNDSTTFASSVLTAPYKLAANNAFIGDYRPKSGSLALKSYNWNDSAFYKFETNGSFTNLIDCPARIPTPSSIQGPKDECSPLQVDRLAVFYVGNTNKNGILRYNWQVPEKVHIVSGQGTATLTVSYDSTFISGSIGVASQSYCGVVGSNRFLAISQPMGIGNDTAVYITCAVDKFDLQSIYETTGITGITWNTATPSEAGVGTYQFSGTLSTGCIDTAIVVVKQDVSFWTGAVTSNWHHTANWSTGSIPGATTHVIIRNDAINPCEISADDAVAASVQVTAGGMLSLKNDKKIILSGKCDPLPSGE